MKFMLKDRFSKQKLVDLSKTIYQFLLNPPLLICLGIAWIITNGWSYIAFTLGIYFDIPVLVGIASAYLAFLWVPFTPEKIFTVIIAIALLKRFFPDDERTLKKLEALYAKYKVKKNHVKENIKENREIRREAFAEHINEHCSEHSSSIKCKNISRP